MSDELSPAAHAAAIDATRQELIRFVARCGEEQWRACPVDGDPRPVSVITDHVADAYGYLSGYISELLAGESPQVTEEIIDGFNAKHAAQAAALTQHYVADHLRSAGDTIIAMIGGLSPDQLALGDGRVAVFAEVAARHARSHREELEAALRA
jgi:hypothetical protein